MKKNIKNNYKKLPPFRFREIDERVLMTNDVGDHVFLSKNDFSCYLEGSIDKSSEIYKVLEDNNFIEDKIDLDKVVGRYESRKSFIMNGGPSLHILVTTLRCNHMCLYCHASASSEKSKEMDMTEEVAKNALDVIFKSTSKIIVIEFQGGEPLLNWPVVKYVIDEAKKRNKQVKKELEFRIVSNLSVMSDDKLDFLLENGVNICTSLDGPSKLHNKNRPFKKSGGYDIIVTWIRKINKKYLEEKSSHKKLFAIPTISRYSLKNHKLIIDEYLKNGFKDIFLRPINPFGISGKNWKKIGYSASEYIEFYLKSLDYILELNLNGQRIVEKTAQYYLQKIFTDIDPNYLEMRSPCGAGIGQLAYNYNGDIYTCDEGRMLSMMGDESFKLGSVFKNTYEELMMHSTTKTLCTASCLENLASCSDCAYLPYCGVCPIYNYYEQGNIYAQMAKSGRCAISMGILDYLFLKLEDKKIRKILKNWLNK